MQKSIQPRTSPDKFILIPTQVLIYLRVNLHSAAPLARRLSQIYAAGVRQQERGRERVKPVR